VSVNFSNFVNYSLLIIIWKEYIPETAGINNAAPGTGTFDNNSYAPVIVPPTAAV